MKKIILSAYACSPVRGSEPGNGWSWAVNIAKLGYEVWCITNVEDKDIIESELKKQGQENLHFVFVSIPFGLDKALLDTSSKKIYLHYYLWRKKAAAIALKLHAQLKFDIAHHVTFGSLQQGTFLWKLKGVKLVFGPAGGGQEALPAFKEYFGKAWRTEVIRKQISDFSFRYNPALRQTLKLANHILVTNKETEGLIKGTAFYDPSRVHLMIDNAVPPSMSDLPYREKEYSGALKLLWVGRMMPRKGLNLVLHALSFVPDSVDYHLTIVGGGEQFPLITEWIKTFKLNPERITILGQIPFTEVIEYYKKSEVFLFCSLRDSCPAQLNEAMAFGLPPIVLDIHGSSLAVPDNCGIKVKATTAVETARTIALGVEKLFNDKRLLAELSRASYQYAKSNTWEAKAKKVANSYYGPE